MVKKLRQGPSYMMLIIFALVSVYPIIWIIFGSLKTSDELYSNIWGPPTAFRWQNYMDAWRVAELGSRVSNSIFITVVSLIVLLFISTLAAYSLARLNYRGRTLLFVIIIGTMMIPPQTVVVPFFVIIKNLDLLNTRMGLMLTYISAGIAFSVFVLHGFLKTIPMEPEEAAVVDGANRFQVFAHVVLPMIRPGLATVAIFQGMGIWNEFFMALILVRNPKLQTIPLGMAQFFFEHQSNWTYYFAALTIVLVPVILLFIFMQRQFIDGLTAGAVKG